MEFLELPEFQSDLKRLSKKYRSLAEDIGTLKKVLSVPGMSGARPPISFRLTDTGFDDPIIVKVKKFACKCLKGRGANSGIRLIYAYYPEDDVIKFVQIYFKADEENEDRQRILRHFKKK